MKHAATGSIQSGQGKVMQLRLAASVLLGFMAMPALAQAELPENRLCTAGFNDQYGWFDIDPSGLGVLDFPAGTLTAGDCVDVTAGKLAIQFGELKLPLAEPPEYDLAVSPPTLLVSLLEPALCEDYNTGDLADNWNLRIFDANNVAMLAPIKGVSSLNYNLSGSVLVPVGNDQARCYSGLAPNADLSSVTDGESEDFIFADGFEVPLFVPDLVVEFLDPDTDTPLTEGAISQASTSGSNIRFKVKVSNVGTADAAEVRVREFVPANPALMMPEVNRIACEVAGSNCAGADNGIGGNALRLNVGTIQAGGAWEATLTRRSSGAVGEDEPQALIQVAAFSSSEDANHANNSRSLRILVVDQISVSHGHTTNGAAGGNGGSISILPSSVPSTCTTAGQVTSCPPGTTGLAYSATANSGYTFTGFSGCAGTTTGASPAGGSYTTSGGNSCALTANFHSMPTVTATAGNHGAITPASQQIDYGAVAEFTISPATGYAVSTATGCGGLTQVDSSTWETAPVTADCAVHVEFSGIESTVTATAGPNGQIIGPTVKPVTYPNSTVFFTVEAADSTYQIDQNPGGTCPTGFWMNGNDYYISGILGDCTVHFTFSLITHQVTVSSMNNGTLLLADGGVVTHGGDAQFTVQPQTGYHLDGVVTGTPACGTVSDDGETGTAGPITSSGCELSASFAINEYTVNVQLAAGEDGTNGTIGEAGASVGDVLPVVIDEVIHGQAAAFAVFPASGYGPQLVVSDPVRCNFQFSLTDSSLPEKLVYKATSVQDNCTVTVGFNQ